MPTTTPKFSVVIPAFNAAATVQSTLNSVLAQTVPDFEVIVVDDGSTDQTASLASATGDERVRVLSQANQGLPSARNAGISVARASLVAFLDSDDLWLPRYLEYAERALSRTQRLGFAYTEARQFNPDTGRLRLFTEPERRWLEVPTEDRDRFLFQLLERNFVWVSTVVPRAVLDEMGGFNPSANAAEDYEMWLKILVSGYDVALIEGAQGLYRVHSGQMSRDERRMRIGELGALNAIRLEDLPTQAHRDLWIERRRFLERELRLLRGDGPLPVRAARAMRRQASQVRQSLGFGERWTRALPADLAAVFPDLTAI